MRIKSAVFLAVLSSLLLIAAFPKAAIWFFAWIALIPWFFALNAADSGKKAFWLSYLVGVLFFLGTIYWINYVTRTGFVILSLYLGFYFAVFGLIFFLLKKQTRLAQFIFLPCLWVCLEYLRNYVFTGFGWALLGYSQYANLPIIQVSDITGAYGVSFLIVLVNAAVFQVLSPAPRVTRGAPQILACVFLALCLCYGYFRLNQNPEGKQISTAVVQGNISQNLKWDPGYSQAILDKYSSLTIQTALNNPDIIIWPETSIPGFLEQDQELFKKVRLLSRKISPSYLLVGTPQENERAEIFNSASLLFGGSIVKRYDKLHLVPFGEFMPGRRFLSRFSFVELIADFTPGDEYTLFNLEYKKPNVKFSVLICFEDLFPALARNFVRRGAEFLVNITNDAWFYDSAEPRQHLQASVFRAVENRVNLVRSANTGVSCFIDPYGRILSRVKRGGKDVLVEGALNQKLNIAAIRSFYTRFGDVFAWACSIIVGLGLIQQLFKRKAFFAE